MMELYKICDRLKSELDALRPLPKETLKSLRQYYRIGLTYSSNALEGSTLTESETKVILEDGLTVGGHPVRELYEALGHSDAYDYMQRLGESQKLELSDIRKLHELFYSRIDPDQAGCFRKKQVLISGSRYRLPPPSAVPGLMNKFMAWYKENEMRIHPVKLAAQVHCRLVLIHPFIDGNGRVARLLMNMVLMRFGYPAALISPVLRHDYIASLEKSHKNPEDFINFILRCEIEALRELLRLLNADGVNDGINDGVDDGVNDGVNDGANRVLVILRESPGLRVPAIAELLGRSRPSVERYLHVLRKRGLVEFRGAPRNGGYFLLKE